MMFVGQLRAVFLGFCLGVSMTNFLPPSIYERRLLFQSKFEEHFIYVKYSRDATRKEKIIVVLNHLELARLFLSLSIISNSL